MTEEGASDEPDNEFAWSSELHDVEIEMFTKYTGPLFLLNMSDSMQTKYNTQKSTGKPKMFFARNNDFYIFSNISCKKI